MVSPAHARVDRTRAQPIAAKIMCGNALSVTIQSPHRQLCTRLRTSKRTTHGGIRTVPHLGGEFFAPEFLLPRPDLRSKLCAATGHGKLDEYKNFGRTGLDEGGPLDGSSCAIHTLRERPCGAWWREVL
jgi:hypothetical protein